MSTSGGGDDEIRSGQRRLVCLVAGQHEVLGAVGEHFVELDPHEVG